jgi:hypothetical protein
MKAEKILKDILAYRQQSYNFTDAQIKEAIQDLENMQDNMQIKLLELKASHRAQIKEIKLRFIEDVAILKELVE